MGDTIHSLTRDAAKSWRNAVEALEGGGGWLEAAALFHTTLFTTDMFFTANIIGSPDVLFLPRSRVFLLGGIN